MPSVTEPEQWLHMQAVYCDAFLLGCCRSVQSVILSGFFWCGHCKFLSVSATNDAFEWMSLAWQFALFSSGAWWLLRTNLSEGSIATCLAWIGSLIISRLLKKAPLNPNQPTNQPSVNCIFTAKSASERIFKIRSAYGVVKGQSLVALFLDAMYVWCAHFSHWMYITVNW